MFTKNEIKELLNLKGQEKEKLHEQAVIIRNNNIGNKVYLRGLIEFSNICQKNCLYCGIRSGNKNVNRYRLSIDEIMSCVDFTWNNNIKSVALQSGEIDSIEFRDYLRNIIKTIKLKYPNIVITLSCGEYDYDFYKELYDLGVERYLLRIESSNKNFYSKIHPNSHSFENRKKCLFDMQKIGYQVGTGNMIGVPEQTDDIIAEDLLFFVENNFHMFGLGPYIIHTETPIASQENIKYWNKNKENILNKTLNFIALLRIMRPTVNIATATALDVLNIDGRTMALQAGANVIMPSITPKISKQNYFLYQNKPSVDDDCETILEQVNNKVKKANMIPAYGEVGNSLFYYMK